MCCCLQFKGLQYNHPINKLDMAEREHFLAINDITQSKDNEHYVCAYCFQKIRKGTMEKKQDKPIFFLPSFPDYLEEKLFDSCQFKDILLGDQRRFGDSRMVKRMIFLNKLEKYLIKPVVPFCRIGFCPRGRYLQARA